MSRICSKNTKPELWVRKALSSKGYRYRVHYKLAGRPDIAFPKQKVAIFVHGCFWHRHGCDNSVIPKTNRKFWLTKLRANVARDKKVARQLKREKWNAIVIWECEMEDRFDQSMKKLLKFLKRMPK